MPGIFQFMQNAITMISLERTISVEDLATVQFIIAYIVLAVVMFTVLDPRPLVSLTCCSYVHSMTLLDPRPSVVNRA